MPRSRVRDVDLYNVPDASEDVHLAWKRVQDECPAVFYPPRYGGYWVITRAVLPVITARKRKFEVERRRRAVMRCYGYASVV